jgi:hypothetical protein
LDNIKPIWVLRENSRPKENELSLVSMTVIGKVILSVTSKTFLLLFRPTVNRAANQLPGLSPRSQDGQSNALSTMLPPLAKLSYEFERRLDIQHNDTQHIKFGIMTLSIITFSIMTLRITAISIMTHSVRTFSIMTGSIMTLNKMTLSKMTLSIMTLSIIKFSIITLSIHDTQRT